jgi:HAD superfamily hydrolase (TIGR01509 family)
MRSKTQRVEKAKAKTMTALLFGSIGTLADTSELQREAFNEAFAEHDLDWNWSRDEYRKLLRDSGGAKRIEAYARDRGETVDADAVHHTKSEIFQRKLGQGSIAPRPGVVDTINEAKGAGTKIALVTTTSPENVTALGKALSPEIQLDTFALVVDTTDVEHGKPAPDAYRYALDQLQEQSETCVAIEDNVGGLQAAAEIGIACVAFPGENNADHDFGAAAQRVRELSFAELAPLTQR